MLVTKVVGTVMPYIELGATEGVATQSVPSLDEGLSPRVDTYFPFGCQVEHFVQVSFDTHVDK